MQLTKNDSKKGWLTIDFCVIPSGKLIASQRLCMAAYLHSTAALFNTPFTVIYVP